MKYPILLTLTVEIHTEDSVFISHCKELDVQTCGKTLEETRERTADMIRAYFAACQKQGTYDQVVARLVECQNERPLRLLVKGLLGLLPGTLVRSVAVNMLRTAARARRAIHHGTGHLRIVAPSDVQIRANIELPPVCTTLIEYRPD